jgi:hypothetical protein
MELFAHLKQVMCIHQALFDRLIADGAEMPLELAEFFEDAGNLYLKFSEQISDRYCRTESKVKEHLHSIPTVIQQVAVQTELVAEHRIVGAEQIAEPLEN